MNGENPDSRVGCVSLAVAWVLLVAVAPFAAVVRGWRRLRRGTEPRVRWSVERRRPLAVVDLSIDVPSTAATSSRRRLVDAVVRVAEALRESDDLYDLVWRNVDEGETVLTAVGRRPQELAERLDTTLSHRSFHGKAQLWLTLPRNVYLTELVDPLDFDPEDDGARTELIGRASPRWAMEGSFMNDPPSTRYRLRFHVPEAGLTKVEHVLQRLRERLAADLDEV